MNTINDPQERIKKMAMKAPKGTKDMLPQDAYRWQYIEDEWAKICSEYGFREIRVRGYGRTQHHSEA